MLPENEESSVHLDVEVRDSSLFPGAVYGSQCYLTTWARTKPQSPEGFFVCFLSWPHLHNHCSPWGFQIL